jgi:hypothetical protein
MLMRYYFGLGVGHTYSHSSSSSRYGRRSVEDLQDQGAYNSDPENPRDEEHVAGETMSDIPTERVEPEREPEHGEPACHESEDEESDSDHDDGSNEESEEGSLDDEELLANDEMYGPEY